MKFVAGVDARCGEQEATVGGVGRQSPGGVRQAQSSR